MLYNKFQIILINYLLTIVFCEMSRRIKISSDKEISYKKDTIKDSLHKWSLRLRIEKTFVIR